MKDFWAHIDPNDQQRRQSVGVHNQESALIAFMYCHIDDLKPLAWLAGYYHDIGKLSTKYQEYLAKAVKNPKSVKRGSVDHSTAGGCVVQKRMPKKNASLMIQMAIYSHHGMLDAINLNDGSRLCQRRWLDDKPEKVEVMDYLENERPGEPEEVTEMWNQAIVSMQRIKDKINDFTSNNEKCGSSYFYWGMYERTLLSLLIEGDRCSTTAFRDNLPLPVDTELSNDRTWGSCIIGFENYLKDKYHSIQNKKSLIQNYRTYISDACRIKAGDPYLLYQLNAPTGSGKTLASLRFALYHAKKYKKSHIIYVAPYCSILEQNAQEIRNAIQHPEWVLEHHSNVINEDEDKQREYDLLTENWDSNIIVTTAVQFLNTLFSSRTGDVRRMHALCNSVIIMDEVQALPIKCIKLCTMAINYLTTFAQSTVVMCSATQPIYDRLDDNKLLKPKEMVEITEEIREAFRRVHIIDKTTLKPSGMTIDDLSEFVVDTVRDISSILIVVNTKACAAQLFQSLKYLQDKGYKIFHLSTNMYPEHRKSKLKTIREMLEDKQRKDKIICISTNLIEAGVDISFDCAIRSLAGLDSLIQTAGRCNRHGDNSIMPVYLIKMSNEAERTGSLKELGIAQKAMEDVLYYRADKDIDFFLDEMIELYYRRFYMKQLKEMEYCSEVEEVETTLVELLSGNETFGVKQRMQNGQGKGQVMLEQAFKTAGRKFKVIEDDYAVSVVVECDESQKLLDKLENPKVTLQQYKQTFMSLQAYTVGVSRYLINSFKSVTHKIPIGSEDNLIVWSRNYYSDDIGITKEPDGMNLLLD